MFVSSGYTQVIEIFNRKKRVKYVNKVFRSEFIPAVLQALLGLAAGSVAVSGSPAVRSFDLH